MLKTKYVGHNFEMLLTNHGHQHIDVANITITAMNGKIIFKGALAGHVISHVLGDETASPDAESTAENLHNTYAAMPEKRQRRFWVRIFLSVIDQENSLLTFLLARTGCQRCSCCCQSLPWKRTKLTRC